MITFYDTDTLLRVAYESDLELLRIVYYATSARRWEGAVVVKGERTGGEPAVLVSSHSIVWPVPSAPEEDGPVMNEKARNKLRAELLRDELWGALNKAHRQGDHARVEDIKQRLENVEVEIANMEAEPEIKPQPEKEKKALPGMACISSSLIPLEKIGYDIERHALFSPDVDKPAAAGQAEPDAYVDEIDPLTNKRVMMPSETLAEMARYHESLRPRPRPARHPAVDPTLNADLAYLARAQDRWAAVKGNALRVKSDKYITDQQTGVMREKIQSDERVADKMLRQRKEEADYGVGGERKKFKNIWGNA